MLLALVEAADSFAPARCWPAQPSVLRKAAAGSRIVLVDALEPLDDPRLDLKLSASPAALAYSPVAWRIACARVMARSVRVAYASADEKNAEMAGAVLRPSVDPEHDCGLF